METVEFLRGDDDGQGKGEEKERNEAKVDGSKPAVKPAISAAFTYNKHDAAPLEAGDGALKASWQWLHQNKGYGMNSIVAAANTVPKKDGEESSARGISMVKENVVNSGQ